MGGGLSTATPCPPPPRLQGCSGQGSSPQHRGFPANGSFLGEAPSHLSTPPPRCVTAPAPPLEPGVEASKGNGPKTRAERRRKQQQKKTNEETQKEKGSTAELAAGTVPPRSRQPLQPHQRLFFLFFSQKNNNKKRGLDTVPPCETLLPESRAPARARPAAERKRSGLEASRFCSALGRLGAPSLS